MHKRRARPRVPGVEGFSDIFYFREKIFIRRPKFYFKMSKNFRTHQLRKKNLHKDQPIPWESDPKIDSKITEKFLE